MNSIASLFTEFSEVRQNADDYLGEDGLLYCGKCRTPKQFRMEGMSFFGNHVLPINCRCRQERIDRENAVAVDRYDDAFVLPVERRRNE